LQQDGREFKALYRDFVKFFWIEHFGLLLLLVSGVFLVVIRDFSMFDASWFQLKIALILFVLLPIEAVDIWFGHVRLPRVFSLPDQEPYNQPQVDSLKLYEQRFAPIALPILLATVAIVMWLAIAKPM
jgi:hypothetical protein